jgi:signal transduction histidine kinase
MATVGRLSLKVAHEVRNPIAAIGLNAELLGDIVQDHPGAQRNEAIGLVGSIREQVSALDALTEEYLAFARFPKAQFEEDSVNDMVRAVTEFVRPLAGRQGTTVSVATDDTIPAMEIDRSLLRQAVLNLIKNGLEAASQGGTLSVTTRRLDDSVELSVSDTGPASHRTSGRVSSSSSSPRSPRGRASGSPSRGRSWRSTAGPSDGPARRERGRPFTITLPIKEAEHA